MAEQFKNDADGEETFKPPVPSQTQAKTPAAAPKPAGASSAQSLKAPEPPSPVPSTDAVKAPESPKTEPQEGIPELPKADAPSETQSTTETSDAQQAPDLPQATETSSSAETPPPETSETPEEPPQATETSDDYVIDDAGGEGTPTETSDAEAQEEEAEATETSSSQEGSAGEPPQMTEAEMRREAERKAQEVHAEKRRSQIANAAAAVVANAPGMVLGGLNDILGSVRRLTTAFISGGPMSAASRVVAETLSDTSGIDSRLKAIHDSYGIMEDADPRVVGSTVKGRMMQARTKAEMEGIAYAQLKVDNWLRQLDKDPSDLTPDDVSRIGDNMNRELKSIKTALDSGCDIDPQTGEPDRSRPLSRERKRVLISQAKQYGDGVTRLKARTAELHRTAVADYSDARHAEVLQRRQEAAQRRAEADARRQQREAERQQKADAEAKRREQIENRYATGTPEQRAVWDILRNHERELDDRGLPTDGKGGIDTVLREARTKLYQLPKDDPSVPVLNNVIREYTSLQNYLGDERSRAKEDHARRPDGTYGGLNITRRERDDAMNVLNEWYRRNRIKPGNITEKAARDPEFVEAYNRKRTMENALDYSNIETRLRAQAAYRGLNKNEVEKILADLKNEQVKETRERSKGKLLAGDTPFSNKVRMYEYILDPRNSRLGQSLQQLISYDKEEMSKLDGENVSLDDPRYVRLMEEKEMMEGWLSENRSWPKRAGDVQDYNNRMDYIREAFKRRGWKMTPKEEEEAKEKTSPINAAPQAVQDAIAPVPEQVGSFRAGPEPAEGDNGGVMSMQDVGRSLRGGGRQERSETEGPEIVPESEEPEITPLEDLDTGMPEELGDLPPEKQEDMPPEEQPAPPGDQETPPGELSEDEVPEEVEDVRRNPQSPHNQNAESILNTLRQSPERKDLYVSMYNRVFEAGLNEGDYNRMHRAMVALKAIAGKYDVDPETKAKVEAYTRDPDGYLEQRHQSRLEEAENRRKQDDQYKRFADAVTTLSDLVSRMQGGDGSVPPVEQAAPQTVPAEPKAERNESELSEDEQNKLNTALKGMGFSDKEVKSIFLKFGRYADKPLNSDGELNKIAEMAIDELNTTDENRLKLKEALKEIIQGRASGSKGDNTAPQDTGTPPVTDNVPPEDDVGAGPYTDSFMQRPEFEGMDDDVKGILKKYSNLLGSENLDKEGIYKKIEDDLRAARGPLGKEDRADVNMMYRIFKDQWRDIKGSKAHPEISTRESLQKYYNLGEDEAKSLLENMTEYHLGTIKSEQGKAKHLDYLIAKESTSPFMRDVFRVLRTEYKTKDEKKSGNRKNIGDFYNNTQSVALKDFYNHICQVGTGNKDRDKNLIRAFEFLSKTPEDRRDDFIKTLHMNLGLDKAKTSAEYNDLVKNLTPNELSSAFDKTAEAFCDRYQPKERSGIAQYVKYLKDHPSPHTGGTVPPLESKETEDEGMGDVDDFEEAFS